VTAAAARLPILRYRRRIWNVMNEIGAPQALIGSAFDFGAADLVRIASGRFADTLEAASRLAVARLSGTLESCRDTATVT